jgi:hypothetical protein
MPLTVGLDGGYVHSSTQTSRKDGWFEVIAGKSMPTDGEAKCFAFVQKIETKPRRRLFEVLSAQGMQANQSITFLTDGGEDIRHLPRYLNPHIGNHRNQILLNARVASRGASAAATAPSRSGPGTARWSGRRAERPVRRTRRPLWRSVSVVEGTVEGVWEPVRSARAGPTMEGS